MPAGVTGLEIFNCIPRILTPDRAHHRSRHSCYASALALATHSSASLQVARPGGAGTFTSPLFTGDTILDILATRLAALVRHGRCLVRWGGMSWATRVLPGRSADNGWQRLPRDALSPGIWVLSHNILADCFVQTAQRAEDGENYTRSRWLVGMAWHTRTCTVRRPS
jgi:hypothetical protein